MNLTNAQMAFRYMAGEVVVIQRLLDLHDVSRSRAEKMLAAAHDEAVRFLGEADAGTRIEFWITARGKVHFTITP